MTTKKSPVKKTTQKKSTTSTSKKIKVMDVPKSTGFTGSLLLEVEAFDYCPELWLSSIKCPKDKWPVIRLTPFSPKQRHILGNLNKKIAVKAARWASDCKIDLEDKSNEYVIGEKYVELEGNILDQRNELVRQSILGFVKNPLCKFIKSDKDEGIHEEIFNRFPNALIDDIYRELSGRATLGSNEILGL